MSSSLIESLDGIVTNHSNELIEESADSFIENLLVLLRNVEILKALGVEDNSLQGLSPRFTAVRKKIKEDTITNLELDEMTEELKRAGSNLVFKLNQYLEKQERHMENLERVSSMAGVDSSKAIDKAKKMLSGIKECSSDCELEELSTRPPRLVEQYHRSLEGLNSILTREVDGEIVDIMETLIAGRSVSLSDVDIAALTKIRQSKFSNYIQVSIGAPQKKPARK